MHDTLLDLRVWIDGIGWAAGTTCPILNCYFLTSPSVTVGKPVPIAGIYKGLGGMRGNQHVPFSGSGGAVMRCCYPTSSQILRYEQQQPLLMHKPLSSDKEQKPMCRRCVQCQNRDAYFAAQRDRCCYAPVSLCNKCRTSLAGICLLLFPL